MLRLFATALALAVIASLAPADAAAGKSRKKTAVAAPAPTAKAPARYRNPSLFPPGPVYFSDTYMGTDPDPFIRSQLLRDKARFGGEP